MDFIIKVLRTIFFEIDSVVYGLIDDVYALLLKITRTTIFDDYTIQQFARRIYALVGIFMLFKVTVSIVNYILNPDDFSDKEKGFSSIIKHIILSLVMMVLVPYIFSEAYSLQAIILEENTIMNLVFGSPADDNRYVNTANSTYADTAGKKIQFTLLYTFAQPNYKDFMGDLNYNFTGCRNPYVICSEENGNLDKIGCTAPNEYQRRLRPFIGDNQEYKRSDYIYELNNSCFGTYNPQTDTFENGELQRAFADADETKAFANYAQGVSQKSYSLFWRKDVILAKESNGENRYLINYRFLLSTIIGGATVYLLVLFCIDIAIRSVKLGFLQMIAPIPILSYCDPKSGKDGMFKKWTTMCFKTYVDLFIRLFALYFGIYVITIIGTFYDVTTGEMVDDFLVQVFMIIGMLMFAKKLPDFLKDALGIDGGTFKDFKLNPIKRLEEQAVGGKTIKRATGVATGIGIGTLAGAAGLATGKGIHRATFGKAIAGGWNGDKFGKLFSSSYNAGKERHKQLQEMEDAGVKRSDVFNSKIRSAFGMRTKAEEIKNASDGYKAIQDTYKNYEAQAAGADDIAKMMKKELENATARGESVARDRWQKAFDDRMQEIASNGYNVRTGVSATDLDTLRSDINAGSGYSGISAIASGSNDLNVALKNYAGRMHDLAQELNKSAVGKIDGASTIADDPTVEIKKIKGQAQGVQNAIDSNTNNKRQIDAANYTNSSKK